MEYRNAICYSGYREGQNPREGIYPTYNEIKEDLIILSKNWQALRLYDCSHHARLVLDVIRTEKLDFKVMLGADVAAEMNNPGCPWGAQFSEEMLEENRRHNHQEIQQLIALANAFPDIVDYVSVGNEASVEWTDHLISVEKLVEHVKTVKSNISQPVTFCENYVPWTYKLDELVAELDFISLHTYPVWEYKTLDDALEYTKQNYYAVADKYPNKPVIITEAGWATASNGRGIEEWNASEELQAAYYEQLLEWTRKEQILTFVFEAFDEPWKGDAHPQEPEKHWGLFKVDRTPKLVMQALYG
ncbi:glycosyl hydrolase family 17 protein [Enterovibrio sp. ZSDZ35]|uniref:Endo-1,3-beta-glucanase btgC n=1 Tax=Enterovibrio qingdaonensis TaxID=2899818 RepID=A0ABT5QPF8_9GAMM|nr:glycosyl hydrolase family 17 protein [Enterovibrio sp. ZSDZ35]MDD1782876.1 glycosyl hydrolase family 17 protein [Enterovibrio sp. ZSDZ35]